MDRRFAPPDAIVVLGCRPGGSDRARRALARRAERAARAFLDHSCRVIIASGGRRWHGVSEAELLAEELAVCGVPPSSVVRELCSLSTFENAWYSAELLRAGGYARPLVVTCDWHLPRAVACFEWLGVEVIGLGAISPARPARTRLADFVLESAKRAMDRYSAERWNAS